MVAFATSARSFSFVSTTGSVVGGGALLFVYALGMGVLFWALAAFALSLPKSGAWMEAVKSVGGIGLLFASVYFLKPFIPFVKRIVTGARSMERETYQRAVQAFYARRIDHRSQPSRLQLGPDHGTGYGLRWIHGLHSAEHGFHRRDS